MSDEWTPCHHCKDYDPKMHWCKLFRRHVRDGCPYGEEAQDDAGQKTE